MHNANYWERLGLPKFAAQASNELLLAKIMNEAEIR
jgi:hypothetical protein